jgi:hypothetical protein
MAQRSPFPGMDPWLEKHWGDLHHRIVQYGCDQLADRLPSGLFAAVEETVRVFESSESLGRVRPDVAVLERDARRQAKSEDGGGGGAAVAAAVDIAVADPIRIRLPNLPVVESHVEIRAVGGGEPLVTAIEIISPTNKTDPRGRQAYLRKRAAYYDAGVNVVEIDLLREGEPVIDVPWDVLPDDQRTAYRACVRRAPIAADVPLEIEYYPMPLRQRLPTISIPLRIADADVVLDVQRCIDQAYEMGRYALRVDYTKPPTPPLPPEDATWAREVVAASKSTPAAP